MLRTSENLGLLNSIRQKYTRSGVIQENTYNITWKCFRSMENQYKDIAEEKREIEVELQAARKKLAEEMEQHKQCRREFAETHREYMRLRKGQPPEKGQCNSRRRIESYPGASTSKKNPSLAEDILVEEPQVQLGAASEFTFMAPAFERNPAAHEETPVEEPQVELNIGDLVDVTDYLLHLGKAEIHNLGLTLGLYHPHLKSMRDSETFREDMIAAWLQKEDHVTKMGVPTWKTLVKALRHTRVNQTGIAEKIETDKYITY